MTSEELRCVTAKASEIDDLSEAVLAAIARYALEIASDPDLAERLASILRHDEFLATLTTHARERNVEIDGAALRQLRTYQSRPFGCRLATWPSAFRRGWHPIAIEVGPHGIELVWGCGALRSTEPFYQSIVATLQARPLNRMFAVRTPLTAAWVTELESDALPIGGLIFHMSRCGSTLLAQALKAWPGERVFGEPPMLDSALTLALSGADPEWLAFRAVLAALARPGGGDRRLWVKLDAWHALALQHICEHVPAPWLFVYRDPVQVLVSHASAPGLHTVRGGLDPNVFAELACNDLPPTDFAAAVLGAICASVVSHASEEQLVNYDEFPEMLTKRLPECFGLDPLAMDRERLDDVLSQHAKRPHEIFVDDRASKRAAASASVRDAAQKWIDPHYFALEAIRLRFSAPRDGSRASGRRLARESVPTETICERN